MPEFLNNAQYNLQTTGCTIERICKSPITIEKRWTCDHMNVGALDGRAPTFFPHCTACCATASPRVDRYLKGRPMKFRRLHDRVVIKRLEGEEKSKGGIIIPDSAKEKPQEGMVVAVGPGGRDEAGKLIPIDLKAGDKVLFGKWSGTEVKIDGEDLLIMKESDIMGVCA